MINAGLTVESTAAEDMAEALYQIGKPLLLKKDFVSASVWLDRAYECIPKTDAMGMSSETRDLRTSIVYSLAIALLGVQTPSGNQRAQELANALRADDAGHDDRRYHLIQLELFASPLSESFDANGYANVLLQMVAAFNSSTADFQLLHHHIQKLHGKSPGLGCKVLDDFLLSLRHRDDATEWIDKLIITRVWLLAHQRETPEELDAVQSVLSKLRRPIGADTASAAQTVRQLNINKNLPFKPFLTVIFPVDMETNRAKLPRKKLRGGNPVVPSCSLSRL